MHGKLCVLCIELFEEGLQNTIRNADINSITTSQVHILDEEHCAECFETQFVKESQCDSINT